MSNERQYRIGDIVIVKESSCLSQFPDCMGYVYFDEVDKKEKNDITGEEKYSVRIFTEHAEDLGEISYANQQRFLVFLAESPYRFRLHYKAQENALDGLLKNIEIFKPVFDNMNYDVEESIVKELAIKIQVAADENYVKQEIEKVKKTDKSEDKLKVV